MKEIDKLKKQNRLLDKLYLKEHELVVEKSLEIKELKNGQVKVKYGLIHLLPKNLIF